MNQQKQKIISKALKHKYLTALTAIALLMISINVTASENTDYEITSPFSGVIKHIYISTGKAVKKGDLLLEFDDSLIVSNLSEAQSTIRLAKLNRAEAKKEFQRAEELYDRTVLSEHELQQAKVLYAKAEAQYAKAENQLIHAQWDIKHSKLYAGFTGKVSRIYSYPGQYVNNQFSVQPLLQIKSSK